MSNLVPQGRIWTIVGGGIAGVVFVAVLKRFNPFGLAARLGL